MKTCTRCEVEKPLDAFSPHPARKDGRTSWCKDCKRGWAAERRAKPGGMDRDRANSSARRRAAEALIRKYPEEFAALLDRERAVEGLPPVPWERRELQRVAR